MRLIWDSRGKVAAGCVGDALCSQALAERRKKQTKKNCNNILFFFFEVCQSQLFSSRTFKKFQGLASQSRNLKDIELQGRERQASSLHDALHSYLALRLMAQIGPFQGGRVTDLQHASREKSKHVICRPFLLLLLFYSAFLARALQRRWRGKNYQALREAKPILLCAFGFGTTSQTLGMALPTGTSTRRRGGSCATCSTRGVFLIRCVLSVACGFTYSGTRLSLACIEIGGSSGRRWVTVHLQSIPTMSVDSKIRMAGICVLCRIQVFVFSRLAHNDFRHVFKQGNSPAVYQIHSTNE